MKNGTDNFGPDKRTNNQKARISPVTHENKYIVEQ